MRKIRSLAATEIVMDAATVRATALRLGKSEVVLRSKYRIHRRNLGKPSTPFSFIATLENLVKAAKAWGIVPESLVDVGYYLRVKRCVPPFLAIPLYRNGFDYSALIKIRTVTRNNRVRVWGLWSWQRFFRYRGGPPPLHLSALISACALVELTPAVLFPTYSNAYSGMYETPEHIEFYRDLHILPESDIAVLAAFARALATNPPEDVPAVMGIAQRIIEWRADNAKKERSQLADGVSSKR